MVIIHDYWIDDKSKSDFFYIRSREEISECPICGNTLKVVGSRKRVLIEHEGTKKKLIIRRLKCQHCNRIHHELPDTIVPYKRYSSEVVECCICDEKDALPCELTTIQKIKIWYFFLESHFESTFEALKILYKDHQELQREISMLLPLKKKRLHPDGWLKKLVRIIVNSNRWVHTRFAF